MRLHRLEVEGFRCFSERIELKLDPNRISVLHGANGSGKSTLVWALVRGLLDTYRAGGKSVEALSPWGTNKGPRIVVDFEHEKKVYRIEKAFLRDKHAQLSESRGNKFKEVLADEKAEARVREMLASGQSAVGLIKPERWGLARALWSPQEHLAVEEFDEHVIGSVQKLLGHQAETKDARDLGRKVEALSLEYWTAGGKPRTGQGAPTWVQLQGKVNEVTAAYSSSKETLARIENEQRRASELAVALAEIETGRDEARKRLEALELTARAYEPRVEKSNRLKAEWELKETEARSLARTVETWRQLSAKDSDLTRKLEATGLQLPEATAARDLAVSRFAEANTAVAACAATEVRTEESRAVARRAEAYHAALQRHRDASSRLDLAERAQVNADALQRKLADLRPPDESTLETLEKLGMECAELKTKLEAAFLRVELRPDEARSIEVTQGSPAGTLEIKRGETLVVSGSPAIQLVLEGFGAMSVTGPPESVEQLQLALARRVSEMEKITEAFGTANLTELRTRRDSAVRLGLELAAERRTLQEALRGAHAKALAAERAQAGTEIGDFETKQPEWRDNPPDSGALQRKAEADAVENSRRKVNAAQEFAQRQIELNRATECLVDLQREKKGIESALQGLRDDLRKVQEESVSLQALTEDLKALTVEANRRKSAYEVERSQVSALGEDPRVKLEGAGVEVGSWEKRYERAAREHAEHKGSLAGLLESAPYESAARQEEELGELQAAIDRDRLRADGVKRLQETLNACRDDAAMGVSEAVAERATRILRRIAGEEFGEVHLNDGLAPASVAPSEGIERVDLAELSGGEREQVHLAVRLALAELLTKDGGRDELVVLDDVLTFTDEARLGRVLEIVSEMSSHAQFLILTCHPERYKPLKEAKFVNIERLRA